MSLTAKYNWTGHGPDVGYSKFRPRLVKRICSSVFLNNGPDPVWIHLPDLQQFWARPAKIKLVYGPDPVAKNYTLIGAGPYVAQICTKAVFHIKN